jgi:tRNA(fMet)-specific endonuclease VapC
MILLDTDTFTLLTRGHQKVTERVGAANGEELLRAQRWLQGTEADLARLPVVPFDDAAIAEFDRLLGTKGLKKIGRGDLMIASIALVTKATLITRNLKDFRKIPGLQLENWAD